MSFQFVDKKGEDEKVREPTRNHTGTAGTRVSETSVDPNLEPEFLMPPGAMLTLWNSDTTISTPVKKDIADPGNQDTGLSVP